MYSKVTNDIRVTVKPAYLEEESSPDEQQFLWSYTVTLENLGKRTVQLLSRHWRITDARGHTHEVRGAGVIGAQPTLKPGDRYQYSSWTPLPTATGFMIGSYQMKDDRGDFFDIQVPAFSLDSPYVKQLTH